MKTIVTEALKTLLYGMKLLLALLAVILLLCEVAPDSEMSLLGFLAIKAGAIALFYLLYKDFLFCGRHNLLPFFSVKSYEELLQDLQQ